MLEELNENNEVINTIIAKSGISIQMDSLNSKLENLNSMNDKMKNNEEIRQQEKEERERKLMEELCRDR